jgi:hypothetical protein
MKTTKLDQIYYKLSLLDLDEVTEKSQKEYDKLNKQLDKLTS